MTCISLFQFISIHFPHQHPSSIAKSFLQLLVDKETSTGLSELQNLSIHIFHASGSSLCWPRICLLLPLTIWCARSWFFEESQGNFVSIRYWPFTFNPLANVGSQKFDSSSAWSPSLLSNVLKIILKRCCNDSCLNAPISRSSLEHAGSTYGVSGLEVIPWPCSLSPGCGPMPMGIARVLDHAFVHLKASA